MPSWAWSECRQPLPIDQAGVESFLSGTKGTRNGQLHLVGF